LPENGSSQFVLLILKILDDFLSMCGQHHLIRWMEQGRVISISDFFLGEKYDTNSNAEPESAKNDPKQTHL
jgi:hypothetical protein